MGLFVGKRVTKKSAKPFIIIKILISLASLSMLVMGIVKDYNFYFVWLFAILAVGSIIDGIESYFQKEDKWVYLLDFGFGVILFTLAFQFSY